MASAPPEVQRRLLTVTEYEQMVQAGVFREDDRLELIAGELIQMSPIGGRHVLVVNRLAHFLGLRLGKEAVVSVQNPIRLEHSEPQPDLALLHPHTLSGPPMVPTAADVLLVVEVNDTTQAYDRLTKIPLYAQAGIAEAWLLDLAEEVAEVYRRPGPGGYREKRSLEGNAVLQPAAFPEASISLIELLR